MLAKSFKFGCSLSKISDNASEGSYNAHENKKKGFNADKFRHTKQGTMQGSSIGGVSDLKIEGSKN